MKSIIFDLDLTLIDSSIAEEARNNRDWARVYSLIPQFKLYEGIEDVFQQIRLGGNKTAIVSTAPSSYVRRVVNYFNMPVSTIIGYHDAAKKPSPAGMLLALQNMGVSSKDTISFGDRVIDIIASKAAGIQSVACMWGSKERIALLNSNAGVVMHRPVEMIDMIS